MRGKTLKKTLVAFGLWVFSLVLMVVGFFPATFTASAETAGYTGVLDDLRKDETFNESDYPAVSTDYSLKVIQIAEGVNGELFVYVYQPSAQVKYLTATSIRLSMPEIGKEQTWQDYDLTLLSKSGVFQKYRVEGVNVRADSVRYYDITAIHRAFDETIDSVPETDTEQTVNEVVYEVAQLWTAQTVDGVTTYSMTTTEVIRITVKIVGFIRYPDGYVFVDTACDSHFIAFNTDRNIDDLLEADVSYTSEEKTRLITDSLEIVEKTGEIKKNQLAQVESTQTGSNGSVGLWGKKYEWKRIEKTADFVSAEKDDITFVSGAMEDLERTKWIIRFCDTDYEDLYNVNHNVIRAESWVSLSDVTILRLKFMTDGVTYNLGVVDNKQTGSKEPLGVGDTLLDDAADTLAAVLTWIVFLAADLLLWYILKSSFPRYWWLAMIAVYAALCLVHFCIYPIFMVGHDWLYGIIKGLVR